GRRLSRLPDLARSVRQRHRAALNSSSSLGSRLTVEALEPRLLLAADARPIAASIDTPGETDAYTINITEPGSYYFDSLTDDNAITWKLTGPNGELVPARGFGSSDSRDVAGSNILDLQVGQYTLTVDGVNDATGAYAFRLLDIADADPFEPGETISGTNPGKETDLFSFDVTGGESFFF